MSRISRFCLLIFCVLIYSSNCFGVFSYIDPLLQPRDGDSKPCLPLTREASNPRERLEALQARISLARDLILRAQGDGRFNDAAGLQKTKKIYERAEQTARRDCRWEEASLLAKPFYAISDAWNTAGTFCGDVRRGAYGLFGRDVESEDAYAQLHSEYEKKQRSIVNPKNAALLVAALGAGYCVKKYYDYKKRKEVGDNDFVPDFSRSPILTERVVAGAVEFFEILLKKGGPRFSKAILGAGASAFFYRPHNVKLAAEDVLDGIYEKEPEFRNAWVALIKWLARDYGIWSLTGVSGSLLEYLPAHGPFIFDLIFPLIQSYMIWHCLMPEMKSYMFYNLIRHLIKYNVVKYFEMHSRMDSVITVSVDIIIEKIVEYLNSPDIRNLRQINSEFAKEVIIQEVLHNIAPKVMEGLINNQIKIYSDSIGEIVDKFLFAYFGPKFRTAVKIVDYSGEFLRKVDWEKFGQQYKVDYTNKPKTMNDVLEFMAEVKQTIEKYKEDRAFLRREQTNKLEVQGHVGLDGVGVAIGTAEPETEVHINLDEKDSRN